MTATRTIDFVTRGLPVPESVGTLRRYIGTPELPQIDPFVLIDWFEHEGAAGGGFAPHPHRGIDTLTLMIEGGTEHFDNIGNVNAVGPGGAQWMRAGRGILHAERSIPENGRVFGLQLWINLSADEKQAVPDYRALPAETMAVTVQEGCRIRTVLAPGDIASAAMAEVVDIAIAEGGRAVLPMPAERSGFVMVVSGAVEIAGRRLEAGMLGRLGAGDGLVATSVGGGRMVVFSGVALNAPVARSGPFVLTTRAEVLQAYRDYRAGAFGPSIAAPPATS